jgi:hypothetical protein
MPDRIARTVIGLFTLTTLVFWLPAVRGAFDGPSYQWGLFGLGGRGVSGDYWFPVVGASGRWLSWRVRGGVVGGHSSSWLPGVGWFSLRYSPP